MLLNKFQEVLEAYENLNSDLRKIYDEKLKENSENLDKIRTNNHGL